MFLRPPRYVLLKVSGYLFFSSSKIGGKRHEREDSWMFLIWDNGPVASGTKIINFHFVFCGRQTVELYSFFSYEHKFVVIYRG